VQENIKNFARDMFWSICENTSGAKYKKAKGKTNHQIFPSSMQQLGKEYISIHRFSFIPLLFIEYFQ